MVNSMIIIIIDDLVIIIITKKYFIKLSQLSEICSKMDTNTLTVIYTSMNFWYLSHPQEINKSVWNLDVTW